MKENTQEKFLIPINENSIFYKIKKFLRNLFHKEIPVENKAIIEEKINVSTSDDKKRAFIESLKNIENEETKLLKLQNQYRSGEIKEENLTNQQIIILSDLYDKQIQNLKRSNKLRRQKLLALQTSN